MNKITLIESLNKIKKNSGEELNEIDWEGSFSDVNKTCPKPEDVVAYLNSVRANAFIDYGERAKFERGKPYIHAKSTFFIKDKEFVDINYFIKKITEPPKSIINTNEKILNTGGSHEFVYKTGIPAFRGIAYDIEKKQFFFINTCPGAGSCVNICYALKGEYIHYPAAYDSLTKRLNYLLNFPDKYEEQMYQELKTKCKFHKALKGYRSKVSVRWNDAGDFFTKKYITIAKNVIHRLSDEGYNITDYAYTKVAAVANDPDFPLARFSDGANKKETGQIDFNKKNVSQVIPKELFDDLDLKRINDLEMLRKRISNKYQININDILTYDQILKTPISKTRKYSVIVTPGDGDDAAIRPDVKNVMLTAH